MTIVNFMLDGLKNLYNLQKQAREVQVMLSGERQTGSSRDATVSVALNGSFEVLEVSFADNHLYDKAKTARAEKEAFESASAKIKESLVNKMKGMQ
ncbi:MAG: YbaB/EbfC family nucleoid-associated protein [Candidatus Sungbacteria bacterium]|nr:YbaB/EbfC family nucleoid-associated protein [Candidatus Sungbacteria bacterium]